MIKEPSIHSAPSNRVFGDRGQKVLLVIVPVMIALRMLKNEIP